jgi:hypothetical protein
VSYEPETQQEDLAAIDAAQKILSAMVVGEKPTDLKPQMDVYARISGYNEGLKIRRVARMFWSLCESQQISGFELNSYEQLLADQKKLVKAKLIRRRKALKSCANIDGHRQKCYCANLARAKAKESV